MTYRVRIEPSQRSFEVEPGDTLLRAALQAGVNLPYGCRNGSCGACKGRVVSGEVDRGDFQPGALSDEERARGYALFCCARPLSDLTVACREVAPPAGVPARTLPCRVEAMERLAGDVMCLRLVLPPGERLHFLPGQYVDILLRDGRRRSFSLANPPHEEGPLELHIRRVPGGHFTGHVFATMRARDMLRIDGPHGGFFLRESARPAILVAGGTGFAPIQSIVGTALHQGLARPMTVYWGARDRAGLYRLERAEGWRTHGIGFVPVLSDPGPGDGWAGRRGLVHEAVMADCPDLSGHEAYVCGSPAMVEAARRDLTARCGLKEDAFFADSFSFAPESSPA